MNTTTNELKIYTDIPQNATSTTITLAKAASDHDGEYTMYIIKIIKGAGLGEQQTIKSYDGRTKIATLHGTWTAVPDTTSVYVIAEPLFTGPRKFETSIDVSIDPDLKTDYESLKETHGMSFSDALEAGMKIAIKSTQSTDEVRRKINEKKTELQDLYTELYFIKEAQRHPPDDTDFRWDRDGKI